jgi:hypothetical protein
MKKHRHERVDLMRRKVVQTIVVIPALSVIGCGSTSGDDAAAALPTSPTSLDPTPACDDGDDDPTPAQPKDRTSRAAHRSARLSSGRAWPARC